MSLEEELAELSMVYHGQRETVQQLVTELNAQTAHALELEQKLFYADMQCKALRQLVRDYRQFASDGDPRNGSGAIVHCDATIDALQQRANELLGE